MPSGVDLTRARLCDTTWTDNSRRFTDCKGVEFAGADLHALDLRGADFTAANLSGANLSGSNLTGANLTRANLAVADLHALDLRRADFTGANLTRANLSGSNLTGANLTRANLAGADLWGANLSNANLGGAIFKTTTMPDGSMRNMDRGATLFYRAFPTSSGSVGDKDDALSELLLTTWNWPVRDFALANGAVLRINENEELSSLLGTTFGGDGRTTFQLPCVALGRCPNPRYSGNLAPDQEYSDSLTYGLTYQIRVSGGQSPRRDSRPRIEREGFDGTEIKYFAYATLNKRFLGEIVLAKNLDERAYAAYLLPADGRRLQISYNQDLFSLIGTTSGGDGQTNFELPDFSRGQYTRAAGGQYTRAAVKPPVDGAKYYIVIRGQFPPR